MQPFWAKTKDAIKNANVPVEPPNLLALLGEAASYQKFLELLAEALISSIYKKNGEVLNVILSTLPPMPLPSFQRSGKEVHLVVRSLVIIIRMRDLKTMEKG
jgi:hypothetical protein